MESTFEEKEAHDDIIDLMVALRIEQNRIVQEINALQASFFEACQAQNTDHIQHDKALIYKRITPGKWIYSPEILAIEKQLKAKRKEFQQLHEPASGREETWGMRLILDEE